MNQAVDAGIRVVVTDGDEPATIRTASASPTPLHGEPTALGAQTFEVVEVPAGVDAVDVSHPWPTTEPGGLPTGGLRLHRPPT